MAESMNPPKAPAVQPPVPASAPPAAPTARRSGNFTKVLSQFLTSTTCLILGLGFIFLAVIVRLRPGFIPGLLKPVFDQFVPHLPYFLVGIGLFFLGCVRSTAAQELISEYRKNRQYPHAWKIPLVSFQVFLLFTVCFIYALPVGLGWYAPLQDLMGLVWVAFSMLLYVLWYLTAHAMNRFPSIAGLRMAVLTAALAFVADILWWSQLIFPAILVAILAVVSLLIALLIRVKGVEQVGEWPKVTLLAVSVVFLAHVTFNALPFGKPTADLVGLTLATKSLPGEIKNLDYFSKDNHNGNKIAFAQKNGGSWLLQIINPENPTLPVFKVPAGDAEFRTVFVKKGGFLLSDMERNGGRGLWKVNVENGKEVLLRSGIEPIEDGVPWSETRGQFLYVTQSEGKYRLNVLTLATGKSKVLISSENPIHTPSWVRPLDPTHNTKGFYPERQVAYADGVHSLFYVVDVKTSAKEAFVSEAERSFGSKFVPDGKVLKVIPAPDGFRYLYLTEKDKKTEIWLILADGTKRGFIYQTKSSIKNLTWTPDGQQILFEEVHPGFDIGFFKHTSTAKLLDANLGSCLSLLPPQISTASPAIASDGVKVAFVAGEGLWYPSSGQGIWVAALR